MLNTEQSGAAGDAATMILFDVFCRAGRREADISRGLEMTGVSESAAFCEPLQSTEDMVLKFLRDRHALWLHWFETEIEARYAATGGGLEIIADVLQEAFENPKCFGLAFIDSVIEGKTSSSEPFAIAEKEKEHLRRFIEQLAAKMGLQHPDAAAAATVCVIERAILRTRMTGSSKEAQTARLLLQCLQYA